MRGQTLPEMAAALSLIGLLGLGTIALVRGWHRRVRMSRQADREACASVPRPDLQERSWPGAPKEGS